MNDAINMLRPKAREALEKLGYFLTGTHNHNDFYAIRTELLRLVEIENERWSVVAARVAAIERAELAEARIAELEAELAQYRATNESVRVCREHTREIVCDGGCLVCEVAQLRDVLAEVTKDRDALRARIDDAPRGRVAISDNFVQPLDVLPCEMRGKRVALVPLGDDALPEPPEGE